jgi:hypothetical protein
MSFQLSMGALTKLDAPVNAPELRRLLILIIYDGCMKCINFPYNISISLYGIGWMGLFDALNAPEAVAYRFFGTLDAPVMHPIAPSCTREAKA